MKFSTRQEIFSGAQKASSFLKKKNQKEHLLAPPLFLANHWTNASLPQATVRYSLHVSERSARNKSLFASFSSEKEDLFFFEKKNQKTFTSGAALREYVGVRRKFGLSTR